MRAATRSLDHLYARRQGLVVELLKMADSSNPEITRLLGKLSALERQLSAVPNPNRTSIEASLTSALNELYALADGDDDLMSNHDYVLIQARLAEVSRQIEKKLHS